MRFYVLHPRTNFEVLRPYRSEDTAHFVCRPVTLSFDLLTLKLVRNVGRSRGTLLPILVIL